MLERWNETGQGQSKFKVKHNIYFIRSQLDFKLKLWMSFFLAWFAPSLKTKVMIVSVSYFSFCILRCNIIIHLWIKLACCWFNTICISREFGLQQMSILKQSRTGAVNIRFFSSNFRKCYTNSYMFTSQILIIWCYLEALLMRPIISIRRAINEPLGKEQDDIELIRFT